MSNSSNSACTLCQKIGLKPFSRDNVLFHYVPMHAMFCYGALSVNVTNPNFTARLVQNQNITNVLLLSTLFGTSFYIYNRSHMKAIPSGKRIAYSIFGSSLFGFTSILVWSIIRVAVSNNSNESTKLATLLGLGSGLMIAKLGRDYFDDCDKMIQNK